jgi:hypothetical protein
MVARHLSETVDPVARQRLLDEHQAEGFEPANERDGRILGCRAAIWMRRQRQPG